MNSEILVNVTPMETRVALVENGAVQEIFIERAENRGIVGNIYKGRVQRVLPGIQAAFIDIGLSQAAFIYVDDVIRNGFEDLERNLVQVATGSEQPEDLITSFPGPEREYPIEEMMVEGQEFLVQVAKSSIGTKGPRVTSYISLPGRYLVLMPYSNHIGVSRRIEDEIERQRLKTMVAEMRDNHFGYIVRTAAEGIDANRMLHEQQFLVNLWNNIRKKYQTLPSLPLGTT